MECYNQFDIYQRSYLSLLEPRQDDVSNSEAYSEPSQTSKMQCLMESKPFNIKTIFSLVKCFYTFMVKVHIAYHIDKS